MNDYKYFDDLNIELIDGDRGKNYPRNDEMFKNEYCLFLNTKNVTINGFVFDENVFITKEKDEMLRKGKLSRNDIVLTTRGTIGNVGLYDDKIPYDNMRINSGMLIIRNNDKNVNTKYLYYQFTSPFIRNQIFSLKTGSAQPQIPITVLKKLKLLIPDIEIQDKIVKVMDSITDKLSLNNEINNNLRELCKTNYLRIIENNGIETSLSELMDYQGGSQPPASEFQKEKNNNNIRFVQIRDFETDSYICYIPNSNKNKLCKKDDILIARYGASLGRICYGLSGAYNVALAKVIPKKEEYKELLRVILESDEFYNYINQVGQRSAQSGFNAGDIAGYTVIIPNENGLKEFNSISKNVIDKRLLIIEENRKISELRDTLLPKLMNGEINLDNIEI